MLENRSFSLFYKLIRYSNQCYVHSNRYEKFDLNHLHEIKIQQQMKHFCKNASNPRNAEIKLLQAQSNDNNVRVQYEPHANQCLITDLVHRIGTIDSPEK